jgi:hypothetical protein
VMPMPAQTPLQLRPRRPGTPGPPVSDHVCKIEEIVALLG